MSLAKAREATKPSTHATPATNSLRRWRKRGVSVMTVDTPSTMANIESMPSSHSMPNHMMESTLAPPLDRNCRLAGYTCTTTLADYT